MPPKNKKGKKGGKPDLDDDAHWESLAKKGSPAASPGDLTPAAADASESDDDFSPVARAPAKAGKNKRAAGGFASFADMMVDDAAEEEEEEEDAPAPTPAAKEIDSDDGLLAMAKKAGAKKAKGKKGKKGAAVDDDAYFNPEDDASAAAAAPAEPEEDLAAPRGAVDAGDDWMEEEFGGAAKGKKGKGGKKGGNKKQQKKDESDDELEQVAEQVKAVKLDEPAPKPASPAPPAAAEDEDEDGEPKRMLSKKEKEKLKKEKEKAKKKAQAAAKKGTEPVAAPAAPEASAAPTAPAGDDAADDEGGEGAASAKNKKKKKKKAGAAADEPAAAAEPAPAAAGKKGKGGGGQIAALRALMEAQQKAREEAERAAEEERRRIEEEEQRAAEEERRKEEERQRKKEKEKAKKEELRKKGLLLTPKQKAERAAAEARRQALLASSGVAVAGLQQQHQQGEKAPGPAKVSYGARKRAGKQETASPVQSKPASPEPPKVEEKKVEPKVESKEEPKEEKKDEEEEDVKDSWDASSSEEEVAKEDVKDSWDASSSSEDEDEAKPAPAASKSNAKAAPASSADKVAAAAAKPTAKGKGKAAAAEESSSEEEEDSDEDSDSDDDSTDDDDDDDDSSDEDSSEEEMTAVERQEAKRRAEAKARREARDAEALAARSTENLRSPICVIMGHVDTGKTKLLDKIRQTNVQEGEAGGITQQIGATYFPMEAIQKRTRVLGDADIKEYKLPGLLVIDTPGHESFTNLRQRGSSLCNIAILVVDIMHGLEPQTLESIRLLRDGKTPFIVALNKIDRLYGWTPMKDGGFLQSFEQQNRPVQREFEKRLADTVVAFAEQGLNAVPYYDNKNLGRNVSLVPTSAHTGEGVPDLLMLLVKLTQERMANNLMYISTLQCTVLEVKVIEGLGTTIDVVLVNGYLHEGDKIVLCGLNGAIVTQVRALLTPQPMKELRIKGQYVHHKSIKAAMGIKIVAPDLEKAIAGSRLLVCGEDDDEDELREEVMSDLTNLLSRVDTSGRGVHVQASTLGSLEALLEFLKSDAVKIPVSGINIGPVHKKDVMRCATMLEKAPEFAVILCFDVPVDRDAEDQAEKLGIRIFKADIIYHLFDQFMAYKKANDEIRREQAIGKAVFPCRLRILQCFAKRDPIILGCDIEDGTLRVGTPLCVVKTDPTTKKKEIISLGKITGLEINHKSKDVIKKHEAGAGVAVKIEHASYESAKQFGRHFDEKDEVVSMVTRESIDVLKSTFRDDVSKSEWQLIAKYLKPLLDIA
ncbi:hypothetical protein JCM3770_006809 [Rhodotorula araucariae]